MSTPERVPRTENETRWDALTAWSLHAMVPIAALAAIGIDRRLVRFGRDRPEAAAPAVAVAGYALIKALEMRRPFRRDWRPTRQEMVTDATFLVSVVATQAVTATAIAPIRRRLDRTLTTERLPTSVGVAVAILAYDLVHSRVHQVGHRWGPGWKLHSVHHSPQRLYWLNATRFHTAEMFIDMMLEGVATAVLGLSREQRIGYDAVRAVYGQIQHSNISLRSGVLDRLFSTPDLHRWHHSTVYSEGDSNYGAVTSFWDQLFGTFYRPTDGRTAPEHLGIGRMPDFPQTFGELELVPFAWTSIRQRNALD